MRERDFYIVDVFAESSYSGNQLAVVRGGGSLGSREMQLIAREMNFSETTFIMSDIPLKDKGYQVRIFTPREEVPFAGHPCLGTAYIIRHHIMAVPEDMVMLDLKGGVITVTAGMPGKGRNRNETLFMRQKQPSFGPAAGHKELSEVLGLGHMDLDGAYPVQEVSTGLPFFIVPVRSLDAMRRIRLDVARYEKFIRRANAKAILTFTTETYEKENQLNVRMFAPFYGISEDPATGSGNGCLAAYLVRHRYFGSDAIDIRVEQGYEIGRRSLLYLKAKEDQAGIEVHVGGAVIPIASGTLA